MPLRPRPLRPRPKLPLTLLALPSESSPDLVLSTEEARRTLQFDKIIVSEQEGPVIFVTGVAIGSSAEAAGVGPPGVVALSDPVNDGELWFLDGTERLAFVQDAIRSTRQYECQIVFESEVTITKALVDKVRPPAPEEEQRENPKPRATPEQLGFERPPPQERREREDLYSDKWAGDRVRRRRVLERTHRRHRHLRRRPGGDHGGGGTRAGDAVGHRRVLLRDAARGNGVGGEGHARWRSWVDERRRWVRTRGSRVAAG